MSPQVAYHMSTSSAPLFPPLSDCNPCLTIAIIQEPAEAPEKLQPVTIFCQMTRDDLRLEMPRSRSTWLGTDARPCSANGGQPVRGISWRHSGPPPRPPVPQGIYIYLTTSALPSAYAKIASAAVRTSCLVHRTPPLDKMTRGNQREKAREKNLKASAAKGKKTTVRQP